MSEPAPPARRAGLDIASVAICSLIWGTTWFAITLQFGEVPAQASVTYRFAIASVLLFGLCAAMRQRLKLSLDQHLSVLGQGVFTFSIQYSLVYAAEQQIASAVVAVLFAGLAFLNIILFRFTLNQKSSRSAWIGAGLGVAGVAVLSFSELARARMDDAAVAGLLMAIAAVGFTAIGNLFAHRTQKLGADVLPATAWSMFYGTALLVLYGLVTGVEWRFEPSLRYVGSLLYLAVFGSVVAFGLYFALARRRGYTLASYISALTPPIAMAVSTLFEGAHFGPAAFAGLALVLAGQGLIIRSPRG